MKRGIIYCRLSRTKGDGQDVSIERQVSNGHAYYKTRPDVSHVCSTDCLIEPVGHRSGVSSSTRPRFRELLSWLNSSRNDLVWVNDLSRLSRGEARDLILSMQKRGHEFIAGDKSLNLSLFDDDLNVAAQDFVNLMQAMTASHKQRNRIKDERAAGAKLGFPPQGLVFSGKGLSRGYAVRKETYTASDGTERRFIDTVIEFFKLYTQARPMGLPTASKELRARGFMWRGKDGTARPVHFKKLDDLTFENYRGFVPDKLLDAAIARRDQRAKRKENGRRGAPEFKPTLLYRLVFCAYCGSRLTYHRSHTRYAFYRHHGAICDHEGEIRDYLIDNQVLQLPPVVRLSKLSHADKDRIARRAVELNDTPRVDRRKALETELGRLEDLLISFGGMITKEKFVTRRAEIIKELETLGDVADRPRLGYNDYYKVLDEMQNNFLNVRTLAPWDANAIMASIFAAVFIDVRTGQVARYELKPQAQFLIR